MTVKVKAVVGWACMAVAVSCIVLLVMQIRYQIIRTVIEIPVGDLRYGLKIAPVLFFMVSLAAIFVATSFSADMLRQAEAQILTQEDDTKRVERPAPN